MLKEDSNTTGITKVQKIWNYVISRCLASKEQSTHLPSSNELAKQFKVNRSTVQLALNKLSKDGFIITKRGSGTYTNPTAFCPLSRQNDKGIIGMVTLNGNQFIFSPNQLKSMALYLAEMAEAGYSLRFLNDEFRDKETAQKMLEHAYVDGLICLSGRNEAVRYAASQLPTVNLSTIVPGVSCIVHNDRKILEEFRKKDGNPEQVRSVVLQTFSPNHSFNTALSTLSWLQTDMIKVEASRDDIASQLNTAFRECPDWIILDPEFFSLTREQAIKAFGEKTARNIRWLILRRNLSPEIAGDWQTVSILTDDRQQFRTAIELLNNKINHTDDSTETTFIDCILE